VVLNKESLLALIYTAVQSTVYVTSWGKNRYPEADSRLTFLEMPCVLYNPLTHFHDILRLPEEKEEEN
jgi:hypothetical protein